MMSTREHYEKLACGFLAVVCLWSTSAEAQANFVKHDENAALVISTDEYSYSDPWHYDSAGYLDLGEEFADAVHARNSRRN